MAQLHQAEPNKGRWYRAILHDVTITDALVAACTLLLTYTAVDQMGRIREANKIAAAAAESSKEATQATKQSVDLAADTAKKQLRAYLSVVKGEVSGLENNEPLRVKLTFKNSGQTPAYAVKGDAKIGIADFPLSPPAKPEIVPDGPPMTLGPGLESYVFWDGNAEDKSQIKSGKRIIHAFGKFQYRDVFGSEHALNFSLIYHGDPGFKFSPLMGPTPIGNDAD
jgi:hypothetical protein